jgi:hypothetical protein
LAVQFSELAKKYLPDLAAMFSEKVVPAIGQLVEWLIANLPGAIDAAVAFFGNLQTTGGQLADFWKTTLQPAIQKVADVVGTVLGPVFNILGTIITDVIMPALTTLWDFLSKYIFPVLSAVANVVSAVLGKALEALYYLFVNFILPTLEKVWKWIGEKLVPIFDALRLQIDTIVLVFQPLLDLMNGFGDWLRDAELPGWLTGHSPSPFEKTLAGIRDTMMEIKSIGLPTGGAGPLMAAPAMAAVGGNSTSQAFNLTVNSSAPREQVVADFGMMQALARRR